MKETKQQKVFRWLLEKKISFTELTEAYTFYLEKKRESQNNIMLGLSIPLIHYWQTCKVKPKSQEDFIRGKSAYYLLKAKFFNTAEVERDLKKCVKKTKFKE